MKRSVRVFGLAACVLLAAASAQADTVEKQCAAAGSGDARAIVAAAEAFRQKLSDAERGQLDKPFGREAAIHWSNLPIGVVPRDGLRLGNLDAPKSAAARALLTAALSACGLELFDEVRLADDALIPLDTRQIGWGSQNYFVSILGMPSPKAPWMLQVGGHHLAYNLTFNGRLPGATPLFLGTEPIHFTADGKPHEPLHAQSAAMSKLATAVAGYPEAKLSGTFTDVVKGVVVEMVPGKPPVGGTDTGYPHRYPQGDQDRGVRYSRLKPAEQALVRDAVASFTRLPGEAIAHDLVKAYLSPEGLDGTFIGFTGAPDLGKEGSYVRIDGPRIWMELIVQRAIATPTDLHYHALWRDKQADYGGEIGQ